jgi:type VI secretion system protein ImpJ
MFKMVDDVQWHEGMLLEPHHFQQMRLRSQQLALKYLTISCPYFWGIQNLIIDQTALVSGTFRITELQALLPDGSVACVLPTDEAYPQVDLTPYKDTLATQPMMIHLAAIRYLPDAANTKTDFPRYTSVNVGPVVDENTGEAEIYIPQLSLILHLIVGNDIPTRYISFPLAEVVFKEEGFCQTDFIPPRTDILNGSVLNKECNNIISNIREKIAFLSDKLQSPLTLSDSPLLQKYQSFFNVLTSQILRLEAVVFSQTAHPYVVFTELCAVAGAVCSMSPGQVPPVFPVYQHNSLRKTFQPVFTFLATMMDLIKRISISVPFAQEDRTFGIDLKPEWVFQDSWIIGIRHSLSMSEKDVMDWLSGAIIATDEFVLSVRDKRILGAQREAVEQIPEMGLVLNKGVIFVKVANDPQFINPQGRLKIFNISDNDDKRPAEVLLYIAS